MSPRDEFPRTSCACAVCTAGCLACPGPLAPGDIERIAAYRGVTEPAAVRQFALDNFCASEGGKLAQYGGAVPIVRQIRTVVPRSKPDGSCVFLDEQQRCTVHPVSPFGCSRFDSHMPQAEAEPRSIAMLHACEASPGYNLLWQMLADAGRIAAPLEERKQAMWRAVIAAEVQCGRRRD